MSNTLNINQFVIALLATTFTDGLTPINLLDHLSWVNPAVVCCPSPDYIVAHTIDKQLIECWSENDTGNVLNDINPAFIAAGEQPTTTFLLSSDDYYLALKQIDGVIHFCITTHHDTDDLNDEYYTGFKKDDSVDELSCHPSGWMPIPQSLINEALRGWEAINNLSNSVMQ